MNRSLSIQTLGYSVSTDIGRMIERHTERRIVFSSSSVHYGVSTLDSVFDSLFRPVVGSFRFQNSVSEEVLKEFSDHHEPTEFKLTH